MPRGSAKLQPSGVIPTERGLYYDEERQTRISTHSMLKTFRRCPKQAEFKYHHRLKPRRLGSPLKRGTWVHELLEIHHNGEDWRPHHAKLSAKFNELFDEEKDYYGDMPTEIRRIMESYEWHYKADPWKVLETEFQVETEFPDGTLYRGKVDALIENQFGLWVVDHKTHKTLPDYNFRLLDAQSALYLWACLRNKIPVQGFIWNYVRWKAPSEPKAIKDMSRLSKTSGETDYPTFIKGVRKLQKEGLRITPGIKERAEYLKRLRYHPGEPQESPFFRRDVLEKSTEVLKRVALENHHTSKRMHAYDFSNPDAVERVVDRSCTFSCSYTDICTAQLLGHNVEVLVRQNYEVGDPNEYYNDKAGEMPEKE